MATRDLVAERDRFATLHPEARHVVHRRDWGVIRAGQNGPALLLIPGTLGRADIFWQQIVALSGEARILSVSYPASGGIPDWADDLAQLIAEAGLQGATVLGSSLGGYLAQYLTAIRPELCGGLVAANTLASVQGIDQVPPYSLDLMATPIDTLRAGFETGLQGWCANDHRYRDLAALLLREVRGRIPEGELRARLQALKTAPDLPAQCLPQNRIFTVESDDDHLIHPQMRAGLKAALNPARTFRFRAASHFPYVTGPEAYTALLREVLGLPSGGTYWTDGEESLS
ncbi:alpha/beta fold hydrolase [Ruegeria marina]|uniref:Maspardin n=1 Tax=Ruegeria marina TaxID=639004 RepID=A0A1G6ZNK1_9RHOB|nr:alpha/beta hydrolase [Ruegeria marina]SDE03415.1 Pimeloyl-ACP methyl ester carboxylesterase [Ruegeria marina]